MLFPRRARFPVLVGLLAQALTGQLLWTPVGMDGRYYHGMATDEARGRVVLLGATTADTFEWTGQVWLQCRPVHRPSWLTLQGTHPLIRAYAPLAHDSGRFRTVLLAGGVGPNRSETWEWDGVDWEQRAPVTSPPARQSHALAYDPVRRRTVLFGGSAHLFTQYMQDTWEWDGTNWTQIVPANSPGPRGLHTMAFDWASNKVLLFGGQSATAALADTWTWDGTNWVQLAPANSPSPRWGTAVAADRVRQRVVLFGGWLPGVGQPTLTDTWEWDGTDWRVLSGNSAVPPRIGHAIAVDSAGRTILFGGVNLGLNPLRPSPLSDLWSWDGVSWSQLRTSSAPSPRVNHAVAYNPIRDHVVLFGGTSAQQTPLGDTWIWDGGSWSEQTLAFAPGPRAGHVMTFDPVRQRVVLFGGSGSNETWEWDGSRWLQGAPSTPPPPQVRPAMVWDAARQRVFLFGTGSFEWDGSQWTQRPTTARPASTQDHTMVFDPRRGKVVLFGGQSWAREMWEWDGSQWSPIQIGSPAPPSRRCGTLVFDTVLARVLLFGGYSTASGYGYLNDVWEWDGSAWTDRTPTTVDTNPRWRFAHAMVHDPLRGRNMVIGGDLGTSTPTSESWELNVATPADYGYFGAGCAGSAGVPVLTAAPWQRPWLGAPFPIEVRPLPTVTAGVVLTGSSATSWLGIPLPLALASAGMPGCSLLASGQIILPLVVSPGVGSFVLPLPNDPALLNVDFFQQAVLVDPPANAAGLIVSNGAWGRIGRR